MELAVVTTSLGYVGCALMGAWAYVQRARSHATQMTIGADNEQLRLEIDAVKNTLKEKIELEHRLGQIQKKTDSQEKEILRLKAKEEQTQKELENQKAQNKAAIEKVKDSLEHYIEQCTALTKQLEEVNSEKRGFRLNFEKIQDEKKREFAQKEKKLQQYIDNLKKDLTDAFKLNRQKDEQLALQAKTLEEKQNADPFAHKQVRKKLSQARHLYQLMRGQKELVEERNQNWEQALRMLAGWVLKQNSKKDLPQNLGTLVATALEVSRLGSLVLDGEDELSRTIINTQNILEATGKSPGPLN